MALELVGESQERIEELEEEVGEARRVFREEYERVVD